MAKLSIQDETYSLDGQELAPGMAIRRYDDAVHMWFEGEVGRTFGYDHKNGQRFEVLNLVVEGYAPSPLQAGQTVEFVGEGDKMNIEKKDTSPIFGHAARHKKQVTIKQENEYLKSWDVAVDYPSDDMPEWFAPLQPIVEDEGFSDMIITLKHGNTGGYVKYHISAIRI